MKEQFTTTVTVSGKGDSKGKAFADALSRVQNTVLKSTSKILLRIEPVDVQVLRATQSVKTEKFLFFFLARERRLYSLDLAIPVNFTVVVAEQVDFSSQC